MSITNKPINQIFSQLTCPKESYGNLAKAKNPNIALFGTFTADVEALLPIARALRELVIEPASAVLRHKNPVVTARHRYIDNPLAPCPPSPPPPPPTTRAHTSTCGRGASSIAAPTSRLLARPPKNAVIAVSAAAARPRSWASQPPALGTGDKEGVAKRRR